MISPLLAVCFLEAIPSNFDSFLFQYLELKEARFQPSNCFFYVFLPTV